MGQGLMWASRSLQRFSQQKALTKRSNYFRALRRLPAVTCICMLAFLMAVTSPAVFGDFRGQRSQTDVFVVWKTVTNRTLRCRSSQLPLLFTPVLNREAGTLVPSSDSHRGQPKTFKFTSARPTAVARPLGGASVLSFQSMVPISASSDFWRSDVRSNARCRLCIRRYIDAAVSKLMTLWAVAGFCSRGAHFQLHSIPRPKKVSHGCSDSVATPNTPDQCAI